MKINKNFKLGEYVLATKFSDQDPQDPWEIGFITEIGEINNRYYCKVNNYWRCFWYAKRITKEFGKKWLETNLDQKRKKLN